MAIDVLTAGEGYALPECFGEHLITGHLVLAKTDLLRSYHFWLGAGPWDSAVKLYYRGGEMPASHYHFHPGQPSAGFEDAVQGVDGFFPPGIPYSETAYLAWSPPADDENPDPAQVVGRYKCRLLPDFDQFGLSLGYGYSANPARALAKLMFDAKISPARIHWPSWATWRDICDEAINWNDGAATAHAPIKRFEAHVALTSAIDLVEALNLFTDLSASIWQDDGNLIRFRSLLGDVSTFTFDVDNIARDADVNVYELDIREIPTRVSIHFRDLDSETLEPAEWTGRLSDEDDDQEAIRNAPDVEFRAMYYSQAQRLAKYYLRRVLPKRVSFTALGSTFQVQQGDRCTIVHPALGDQAVDIQILEVEDQPEQADSRRFTAGLLTIGALYRDEDHGPISKALPVPPTPVAP